MAVVDVTRPMQRRLKWEAPAPLTDLSNQMTASVFSLLRALAQWVRDFAEEKPLISLLIAFEAGITVALLGHRRAKHYSNLLKIAAEAELLRLRTMLARQGRRAAFGVVAVIFMLGVLVLGEIAGWQVLRLYVAPISTTLILLGINFVIAALFGELAARSSPSHTEKEALRVRRQALDAARGTLSFATAVPVASTLLRLGRRRGKPRRSVFRLLRRGARCRRGHVASTAPAPTRRFALIPGRLGFQLFLKT